MRVSSGDLGSARHNPITSFFDSRILGLLGYVFYASSTILWIRADQTPPSWDPADHLTTALQYFRALHEGPAAVFGEFFRNPHAYAPLYHSAVAAVLYLIPRPLTAAVSVNLLLLAVIMAAACGIGRELFGEQEGLWAAVAVPAYPIISWLLHEAFIDLMLIAMVSLTLYSLIRTHQFDSRRWSIILGLMLGLGFLTKQTFAFFIWLPLLSESFVVVGSGSPIKLRSLGLALLLATLVASIWYIPHFQDTLAIFRVNRVTAEQQGHPPPLSILSLLAYPYFLANYQQQVPFFIAFLIGTVYAWKHRRKQSRLLFLLILGSYLSFTLLTNKNPRYTAPVLVPAAIVSFSWLACRTKAQNLTALKGAVLFWCIVSFLHTQWPPNSGEGLYLGSPNRRGLRLIFAGHNLLRFDHRPQNSGWPVKEIFDDVRAAAAQQGRPAVMGVTSNSAFFNPSSFRYYAELARTYGPTEPGVSVDYLLDDLNTARLAGCDFLVTRFQSELGAEMTAAESSLRNRSDLLSGFHVWRSYRVIDGSQALVYSR